MSPVRCKVRHVLADYNAVRKDLFSAKAAWSYMKGINLSDAHAFVIKQLWTEWKEHQVRRLKLTGKIKAFVAREPPREAEARRIVKSAPGVGEVTAEVVLCEVGDVSRFRNAKAICAYAGMVARLRQTGSRKSLNLPITKQGSAVLRWALVHAAWRLVGTRPRWSAYFARLSERKGSKRAIVAVAR
jgi:transposase